MSDPVKSKHSFSSGRRWLNGFNAVLAILAALAVVVMANYLAGGHFARFFAADYSSVRLHPQTLRVLEGLTNHVDVTIFFAPRDEEELYSLVSGLLAEYQNANPKHITVRTLDYTREDGEAKALLAANHLTSLESKNFVLFESNGHSKLFYAKALAEYDMSGLFSGKTVRRRAFSGEMLFTSAILAVSYPKQLKAYFVYGHGEHNPESLSAEDSYSKLASILKDEISSEWARLSLQGTNAIPADCQLLVIAGPREAEFLPNEIEKVDAYLKNGGRLLVLLNGGRLAPGLESILAKWGVGVSPRIIRERDLDRVLSPSSKGADFITAQMGTHSILKPLVAAELRVGIRMILPRVLYPLPNASKTPDAAKVEVLAWTSPLATDGERTNAFPLLLAVEQGVIKGVSAPRGGTRIVIAGDSFFLCDSIIETAANHVFAGSALNWLLERPEVVLDGIGPRPIKEYKLLITSDQMGTVKWLFLAAMPGGILLIGGLVWLRRRR